MTSRLIVDLMYHGVDSAHASRSLDLAGCSCSCCSCLAGGPYCAVDCDYSRNPFANLSWIVSKDADLCMALRVGNWAGRQGQGADTCLVVVVVVFVLEAHSPIRIPMRMLTVAEEEQVARDIHEVDLESWVQRFVHSLVGGLGIQVQGVRDSWAGEGLDSWVEGVVGSWAGEGVGLGSWTDDPGDRVVACRNLEAHRGLVVVADKRPEHKGRTGQLQVAEVAVDHSLHSYFGVAALEDHSHSQEGTETGRAVVLDAEAGTVAGDVGHTEELA